MYEIALLLSLLFIFFATFGYSILFLLLSPFFALFFWLRYREMRKELLPRIFFLYLIFFGVVFWLYTAFYLKQPFFKAPWILLLILFFSYFVIETVVRFSIYGTFKLPLFFSMFGILYLSFEKGLKNPIFSIIVIILMVIIFLKEERIYIKREYGGRAEVDSYEGLQDMWRKFILPYILLLVVFIFIAFSLPLPDHGLSIRFLSFKGGFEHIQPTPKEMIKGNSIQGKNVKTITIYRYKEKEGKNPSGWVKRLITWRPDKSLIVTILLLEMGLFGLLILYKVFSRMRYWYVFLFVSIVFTLLSVFIFSYIVYRIGTYILKGNGKVPLDKGVVSFSGPASSQVGTNAVYKVLELEKQGHIWIPILLNVLLILSFLVLIVIILIISIKLFEKLRMDTNPIYERTNQNEPYTTNSYEKKDTETIFHKLLREDPRGALEYMYTLFRKKKGEEDDHLTPYEFLNKLKETKSFSDMKTLQELTELFVRVRYAHTFPSFEEVLLLWNKLSSYLL